MRLSTRLGTCARQKIGPAACHRSSFTTLKLSVLRPGRKGGSQCSQMSFFSSLPRWYLRSSGGTADSRFGGGVDHGEDGGNPFATSVVRSSRTANKAPNKSHKGCSRYTELLTESNLLLPL